MAVPRTEPSPCFRSSGYPRAVEFVAAVDDLRRWVAEYPGAESRSAEWESEYPAWQEVWSAASDFTADRPVTSWSVAEMDDVLFAIARDNEMEEVVEAVGANPATLIAVAIAAQARGEPDARWQIAARLGREAANREQAVTVLLRMVTDSDEYVRRRALLALGELRADEAESCAEKAWASGLGYQRIAALHVLADIGSARLEQYLQLATEDDRAFVHAAAERARAGAKRGTS